MNLGSVYSSLTSFILKLGFIIVFITNIIYLGLLFTKISYYLVAFNRESILGIIFSFLR